MRGETNAPCNILGHPWRKNEDCVRTTTCQPGGRTLLRCAIARNHLPHTPRPIRLLAIHLGAVLLAFRFHF